MVKISKALGTFRRPSLATLTDLMEPTSKVWVIAGNSVGMPSFGVCNTTLFYALFVREVKKTEREGISLLCKPEGV